MFPDVSEEGAAFIFRVEEATCLSINTKHVIRDTAVITSNLPSTFPNFLILFECSSYVTMFCAILFSTSSAIPLFLFIIFIMITL
jgi:hypothetical protein